MKKLERIRVFPFAIFQTFLATLLGLLAGIIYSFGGLVVDTLVSLELLSPENWEAPGLSYGTVLAFGALVGMPLIFAAAGFCAGIVGAVLYNLVAKWFGGIKIGFWNGE